MYITLNYKYTYTYIYIYIYIYIALTHQLRGRGVSDTTHDGNQRGIHKRVIPGA